MVRVTDAIFREGRLEFVEPLHLRENERVRVTIESEDGLPESSNQAAVARLREGFDRLSLDLSGGLPSKAEMHDRKSIP